MSHRLLFKVENVEGKEFPKKRITGNTRNAALREMLQTIAKVTKATVPDANEAVAKKLAEAYSSETLEQALELRRKFERKQRRLTPRMRHFERDADGRLRSHSGRFDPHVCTPECEALHANSDTVLIGVMRRKKHVCLPECGMCTDKEADALLHGKGVVE